MNLDDDYDQEIDEGYDQEIFEDIIDYGKFNEFLNISLDTEFQGQEPITLQYIVEGAEYKDDFETEEIVSLTRNLKVKIIVVDISFQELYSELELKQFQLDKNCVVYFRDFKKEPTKSVLIETFLTYLYISRFKDYMLKHKITIVVSLWFYFSAKDLNIAFGSEYMRRKYLDSFSKIKQRRALVGRMDILNNDFTSIIQFKFILKDLSGLEKAGLSQMAQSFSIKMSKLTAFDNYKTKMKEGLISNPILFLEYGLVDAEITLAISKAVIKNFNLMLVEIFDIIDEKYHYNSLNIPTTIGVLVSNMYLKYLNLKVFKGDMAIQAAMVKQGVLNPSNKNYKENQILFDKLNTFKSLEDLKDALDVDKLLRNELQRFLNSHSCLKYCIYQYASTKYLIELSNLANTYALSMVAGGRIVNERPKETFISTAMDIDIVSAYGDILRKQSFILGRPNVYSRSINQTNNLDLGQFLDKYYKNLSNKNYQIIVSGELTFKQDLIFSRYISETGAESKFNKFDPDESSTFKSSHPLILLRTQILNGIITDSTWNILKKVCTSQEIKEIKSLKVESALYWLDSDRIDSIELLANIFLKDNGQLFFNRKMQTVVDNRTKKWFAIPFEPIIGSIVKRRKEIKSSGVNFGLQQSLKLWVNTVYGVLCSVYFDLNNVVLGNIITSTIRTCCWLMAKAFNSYISVTDGGISCLNQYTYLKKNSKKPGLHFLSSFYLYSCHKSVIIAPLGNKNWDEIFKDIKENSITLGSLAQMALEHLTDFWANYNIEITFSLEIKNIVERGAYLLKAHYMVYIYDFNQGKWSDNPFYKIRGFRFEKEQEYQNPMYDLLKYIANKGDLDSSYYIPNNSQYLTTKLLKINSWKESLIDKKYSEYGQDILPGDSIYQIQNFRLNNPHINLDDLKMFKTIDRRTKKSVKLKDGTILKPVLFEKYLSSYGVSRMIYQMCINKLRD